MIEEVRFAIDTRDVLALAPWHRRDLVGLRLVVLVRGQAVRPHDRPGRGRGLAGDGRRGLDRIDAGLRRDPEGGEDVRVLGLVVGVEVAHLCVGRDAGGPAVLGAVDGRCGGGRHLVARFGRCEAVRVDLAMHNGQ
jgi:hypothetical protein